MTWRDQQTAKRRAQQDARREELGEIRLQRSRALRFILSR